MKEIWFGIDNYEDQKNVVWAFLSSGHRVRLIRKKEESIFTKPTCADWIIVEVLENNIKEIDK